MTQQKSIEVEGKTTKEAIGLALKKLKVSKDQVKIQILSEENKGLFGMNGNKLAKVKVTLKPDNSEQTS
ncbi:MAG: Jag N-terminal domain-containing protein [Candidatus Omnitrophica bacterium]|nr:Jag N-terminal domain-containing protein [Candidatus Omnitrophota bacterium]